MAKTPREPLLVGVMLCMASVVGLGMLLTMPAYDAWQQTQTQQQQLTTEVSGLNSETQVVEQDILKLSQTPNLPKDITIRPSSASETRKNLKIMLDELIRTATGSGNQLISLLPGDGSQGATAPPPTKPADPKAGNKPADPKAPDAKTAATPNAADTTNQTGDGVAAAAAPVVPALQSYPYALAFRGSFDQILTFLSQLNHHRELVEVTQVELKNEGGPQRQEYSSSAPYNRAKPISIKMDLKLVLKPE
jgi:hypothetical protein